MLRTRRAGGAVRALAQTSRQQRRPFTSSPASISITTAKKAPAARRNQTTSAQSTAEARDIPAPAFNTNSVKDHGHVQPLVNPRAPDMDESFIGKTGGEIFHEMMLRKGVKHIFGYPGGAILPVFDAIYNSKHFDFILPKHEQGAGHMAEGYARASGKPGVVLVTSGPGATNVITPPRSRYHWYLSRLYQVERHGQISPSCRGG